MFRIRDTVCNPEDILCFTAPSSVEQAENIVVKEGDNVELHCNVTGIPRPAVMWTKVGTEHIKGNPMNISRAQAGEYGCTANNTCGVDPSVTDIDVQCT